LAVRRRRAGVVPLHPRRRVGRPAPRRAPPAAAGRPGRRRVRGVQLGAGDRPGRHPSGAAGARRAAALTPLATGGGHRHRRAALVLVGSVLAPVRLEGTSITNPFGLTGPGGAGGGALAAAGTMLWAATMVASLACVGVRFRSSGGVGRRAGRGG